MSKTVDRLLVLGLDGATWSVLDPMRRRGLMPNLDALLSGAAHGTLRSIIPPVTTAAWTTMMTGCGPARHGVFDHRYYDAAEGRMKVNHSGRIRVPTVWHLLSERRALDRLAESAGACIPPIKVKGIVVSGMDCAAPSGGACRLLPSSPPRLRPRRPAMAWATSGNERPQSLEELTNNARLTAESFRGRAEGGWLADRIVPDWSVLMVQFQNLDPFQHRVWPYLNVDETGVDRPDWNTAAAEVIRGLDEAIGRLCELAGKRGRRRDGRERPRLRPLPGPDPRQPHPGSRPAWPGCRVGPGSSAAALSRRATDCGSGAKNATTPGHARRRSISPSPPSTRSIGSEPSHSPRTRTPRRWSTSIARPVMAASKRRPPA